MTDPARTFTVASDEALVALVLGARRRLAIIAPALTNAVADAVSLRIADQDKLDVTVVLDSDPEVYRLGFGDVKALETIRKASDLHMLDLREQAGVRIAVVIADETTMIYSPSPRTIEAGSTSKEKPNAIVLTGGRAVERIAAAAGAPSGDEAQPAEIGQKALDPDSVEWMQYDLDWNPPKRFDIARKLNVFASKVQFVEFSVSNYRLSTRQVPLPPELLDVADERLKDNITSRIRAPFSVETIEITVAYEGVVETLDVNEGWLKRRRKWIEDEYTFQINNFGRVILSADRAAFDREVKRFEATILGYQQALRATLAQSRADFERRVVEEFSQRWAQNPPKHFARWGRPATPEGIAMELRALAGSLFEKAISFDPPEVKMLYKNVAPENVEDPNFLDVLKSIMVKRRVPRDIIDSLFESGQAAPEEDAFRF